jgi:peptidoglycan/xylan/chitin deacetylase (PgdA/CDA1 family)
MNFYEITKQYRLISYLYLFLDKLSFSNNNAIIFMFHHISDEQINASLECKCKVDHFIKILEYLKNNFITVISIEEAIVNIKKGIRKGYAVITFDDGFDNTFNIAYPLLKYYNFPFTVYIPTNYVDKKGYINSQQLELLSKESLCTIGAHTITHPFLNTALNSKEEIVQSKIILENKIKKEVHHFAYPYGGPTTVSFKNIREVRDAEYQSAVSSVGSRLNYISTLNKLYLPRVNGTFFKTP